MHIPSNRNVCAVVISFNPCIDNLRRQVKSLSAQVKRIIVVDNGSKESVKLSIKKSLKDHDYVRFIFLEKNEGIAFAQNVGIESANKQNFGFVLLMDQDSIPQNNMVDDLLDGYSEAIKDGINVAAIGPRFVDSESNVVTDHVRLGLMSISRIKCSETQAFTEVDFLISSGSLIPLRIFNILGGMENELFIDHVDTEWCFRAKNKGYVILGHCSAKMVHSLGESRRRLWFGKWREVPLHKPFRYFYIFRNSIRLYKRPYMPLHWKLVDTVRLLQIIFFMGLFTPNRLEKLKMMFDGFIAGLRS